MPHPWDPDHGLARAELASRLRSTLARRRFGGALRFPDPPEVEWFDEGWDCDVFQARDEEGSCWLCKLPKRGNVQPWIRKEADILEAFVEAGVEIAPRLGARGGAEELPYEWIAISILPGRSLLQHLPDVDPAALGRSYGRLLRSFHPLEPRALGPRPEGAHLDLAPFVETADRALGALRRHVAPGLVREVEKMVRRAGELAPMPAPVVFLHGDLFPEHIFLDLATSEVVGLIDWADASWGDPASDFCLLGWLLGDRCLDAAIEAYGSSEPEGLRRRAVMRGAMLGIYDAEAAEKGAPNVPLAQRIAVLETRAAEGWLDRI